jgi:hypothetical protein
MRAVSAYLVALMMIASAVAQVKGAPEPGPALDRDTIDIGFELRIGMDRDVVITRLEVSYKVVKIQAEGDSWMVQDKRDSNVLVGSLRFTTGKLTYASRRWAQGDEDSYNFAEALWGAMSQINKEGHNSCRFDVPTNRMPTSEWKYVDFYCGSKRIEIGMADIFNGSGKGHYVSIDEVLSSEKNR